MVWLMRPKKLWRPSSNLKKMKFIDEMKFIDIDDDMHKSFEKLFTTSEAILKEHTGQIKVEMQEKIDRARKTLYEQIDGQIDANMQNAYGEAADEFGTGMKQRMVEILTKHAHDVAGVMFEDARRDISVGIRELCDYLLHKYDEMKEIVIRQSEIAQGNLMMDSEKLSPEDIEEKKQKLQQFMALLNEI